MYSVIFGSFSINRSGNFIQDACKLLSYTWAISRAQTEEVKASHLRVSSPNALPRVEQEGFSGCFHLDSRFWKLHIAGFPNRAISALSAHITTFPYPYPWYQGCGNRLFSLSQVLSRTCVTLRNRKYELKSQGLLEVCSA